MREIVTVTKVFPYDELSEQAKIVAREQLVDVLSEMGVTTEAMRQIAATSLMNAGWQEFAELAEGENIVSEEDANRLRFSVGHVQGDFVEWSGTRACLYDGMPFTVKTATNSGGMSWEIVEPGSYSEAVWEEVRVMIAHHAEAILHELHKYDLELVDDEEYLADFATANEIEFTEDGRIYR